MEIKVIELTDEKAKLSFIGESHTFMNMLTQEILKNQDVDVCQYYSEYTFTDPILFVTTKNKQNPIPIISAAATQISNYCAEILAGVEKATAETK